MLGNGDLIPMTLQWPQLGTSLRRLIKSLSHRGSLRHSFLVPSLYTIHQSSIWSSLERLRMCWIIENVPNLKPVSGLPPINVATWTHFSSEHVIGLQKWPSTLTRRCAGRPPSRSLIPVLFFTAQLWDFFSGQSGRTKASFSEGDGHRPSEKHYDGKSHEKFMTRSHIKKLLGAFKCSSNKVTYIMLERCLTCASLHLIYQFWTLTDIWYTSP